MTILVAWAIWTLGSFACLQIILKILNLATNPLVQEFTNLIFYSLNVFTVLLLVYQFVTMESLYSSNRGFTFGEAHSAFLKGFGQKLGVLIRLVKWPFILKGLWLILICLAMLPALKGTFFVLGWPLRVIANISYIVLFSYALLLALLVPLIPGNDHTPYTERVGKARAIIKANTFVLFEALLWVCLAGFVIFQVAQYVIGYEVLVAVFTQEQNAPNLYLGAPTLIRGMGTFPLFGNYFGGSPSNLAISQSDAVLSSILVLFHVLCFVPVVMAEMLIFILPMKRLVNRLLQVEKV